MLVEPGRLLLGAAALLTAPAMLYGAAAGQTAAVTAAAALFALAAVAVSLAAVVRGLGHRSAGVPGTGPRDWHRDLRGQSWSAAIAYGWGALAMQGLYLTSLTGLKWQHGWQYALAMAILGVACVAFARHLGVPASAPALPPAGPDAPSDAALATPPAPAYAPIAPLAALLAAAQGIVAAGGLAALVATGKLWSIRADWAANRVFAALAVAVLAISAAALVAALQARRLPGAHR